MKSLTYEYVKEQIEKEGYDLISKEYKNNRTKLQIKCDKGHIFKIKWNDFKTGIRCSKCSGRKKLTYEYVKEQIEKEGYNLISKEYKNNKTPLKIKCEHNHIFYLKWNHFQNGVRCSKCKGLKKLTYEQVKEFIENEGYFLLSEEYKNSSTKLQIKCDKGHIFKIKWNDFQQGSRCAKCAHKMTNQEIIKKLEIFDNLRENKTGEIEVACKYCGKFYIPKRNHLFYRIYYINGKINKESLFYCSNNCKQECPIFHKSKYPKGFKPATSREVQPQLRKLVFERDNYTCVKCNTHKDKLDTGLHCHHIDAVINNPIESTDIDNCVTLCKDCHKIVHKIPGCGYHELRCTKEEKEV